MKNFWNNWKKQLKKVANVQTNIALTIVYILFIIPLGFVIKTFFQKSLKGFSTTDQSTSFWRKKPKFKQDLTWAKKL